MPAHDVGGAMGERASGSEDLILPSELETLERVDRVTLRCTKRAGLDAAVSNDVAIAVIEAVTNAVVHGNKLSGDKNVRVKYEWRPGAITVCVHDEGAGFDLSIVPDPTDPGFCMRCSGRGIYIMRQVMDSVAFDMSHGTTVTMTKAG
jgi:serine/threonine-protein kinase RsbW